MKRNAYIFETDAFRVQLYDESTTVEMFGQDYLEEYGHVVPTELVARYLQNEEERRAIAKELLNIMNEKSKNETL